MPRAIRPAAALLAISCLWLWAAVAGAQGIPTPVPNPEKWRQTALTGEERAWLASQKEFTLGVGSKFVPIMYVSGEGEEARFQGMVSDYVKIVERLIGVKLKVRTDLAFPRALQLAREGKLDMFPCVAKTPARAGYLLYTKPYLKFPLVIITRTDHPVITGIEDLKGKRIAIVKYLATYGRFKRDHPWIDFAFFDSIPACLNAVSQGRADAYPVNMITAIYHINMNGITNLKVAAPTPYASNELGMAVRKGLPLLRGILQKALSAIPVEQHSVIRNRWLAVSPHKGFALEKYISLAWKIGLALLLLLALVVLWNLAIRRREERFRGLTEYGKDLTLAFREDGGIVYASPSFRPNLGYKEGSLPGSVFDLLPAKAGEELTRLLLELKAGGNVAAWEHHLKSKSGYLRYYESNLINLTSNRALKAFVLNSRDISDRKIAEAALKESESRYRSIFISIADGVMVLDQAGLIVEINRAALQMFGYPAGEMLGARASILGAAGQKGLEVMSGPLKGHEAGNSVQLVCQTSGGGRITVEVRPSSINLAGQAHRLLILRDVTARNAAREALAQWARIFESVQWGVAVLEAEQGRLTLMNPAFASILGYSQQELAGSQFLQLATGEQRETLADAFDQSWRSGSHHGQVELTTRDGGTIPVRLDISAMFDDDGRPSHSIVNLQDISAQVATEMAAQESEARYRLLTQLSPDAIVLHRHGMVLFANQGAARLFAASSPAKLVGMEMTDLVHPDDRELFRQRTASAMGRHQVRPQVYRWRRLDGQTIHIEAVGSQVRQLGEDTVLSVLRDVSDRIKAENERAALEEQLRQAQKMEAIGTLAGGIAHDFNNILGGMVSYLELAMQDTNQAKVAASLGEALDSSDRARDLIKRILSFSRKDDIQFKPLDLNRVLAAAADILQRTLPKMVEIVLSPGENLPPVNGDPTQLEQVILNLATNANDAMPEGGRLGLETGREVLGEKFCARHLNARPGEYAYLRVWDTGHGIDKKIAEHIFDPFFTTKETGKGTGLGLFTVFGISKNHSGLIDCRNREGGGTCFTVYLPALAPQAMDSGQDAPAADPLAGGNETLLLVDDDDALRASAGEILARLGYRVLAAESGEAALEIFRQDPAGIDLVILDVGMPGMGGFKCLDEMLALYPAVKVVIASGYVQSGPLRGALAKSGASFIAKPFRAGDLLRLVRQRLDE